MLAPFDSAFSLAANGARLTSDAILAAVKREPIRGLEATLLQADGRTSALLISASPLWSESSQMLGCVVMLTDITDRKRSEEALARQAGELARSNSDLRQFAYSASHDLREPLRQLAVFSELLQQRFSDRLGEEGMTLATHAVDSAHRMEKLVEDLLAYIQAADAPQDASASTDANEVVRKTLATFESKIAESAARVEFENLPTLDVHEVHLVQLLQNLIGNALKYRSDPPPLIRIAVRKASRLRAITHRIEAHFSAAGSHPALTRCANCC